MQIDGHHTLTYVVARYAGLEHEQAAKLAYCAQYVDEATNATPVKFQNGALFDRIASAHKMLDYRNMDELANHLAWIPFHFLPSNNELPAGTVQEGSFIKRLICRPGSPVAREMLKAIGEHQEKPYGLHLMGIAMHVYADTFAHQGFAGVIHDVNKVEDIESNENVSLLDRVKDKLANWGVSNTSPLGHGSALSFPDRPYVKWSYKNGLGEEVERNNTEIFLDASNAMFKAISCFRQGDKSMNVDAQPDLSAEQLQKLKNCFIEINSDDGHERHTQWLQRIADGYFDFGVTELTFTPEGEGSWKNEARGLPIENDDKTIYQYTEDFLFSDWKLFHDALKTYRIEVIRDVLPKYGICVA